MGFSIDWRNLFRRTEGTLLPLVERKVKAAATAATLTSAAVSVLGLYVLHGTVPDWVTAVVGTAVTGALTAAAGWIARHTPRAPAAPTTPASPARFNAGGYIAPSTPFELPEVAGGPAQGAAPAGGVGAPSTPSDPVG